MLKSSFLLSVLLLANTAYGYKEKYINCKIVESAKVEGASNVYREVTRAEKQILLIENSVFTLGAMIELFGGSETWSLGQDVFINIFTIGPIYYYLSVVYNDSDLSKVTLARSLGGKYEFKYFLSEGVRSAENTAVPRQLVTANLESERLYFSEVATSAGHLVTIECMKK